MRLIARGRMLPGSNKCIKCQHYASLTLAIRPLQFGHGGRVEWLCPDCREHLLSGPAPNRAERRRIERQFPRARLG